MNYCCHADFTETGDINIVDMNVFIGYQSFASINYNDYDSDIHGSLLDHFTNWYQDQVNDGIYPPTSGVINLPGDANQDGTDCANYTETDDNIINISDMNIFIGFQSYASINYNDFDPSTDGNMISHFKSWYNDQVSDGIYPALFLDIKHLPSLKEDSQVWTINGLVEKCVTTALEKLWISFTGNDHYSDWYELETDEEEEFTKFKIATPNYGSDLYTWASGKATNLQGLLITASENKPSATSLTDDQKSKSFASDLLNLKCNDVFNNGHELADNQVNLRVQAYNNQNVPAIKKYGSHNNTHNYIGTGKPWEGANMVYRTTTFNSIVTDDSGKNSIDIDYLYFIKEADETSKIKFSTATPVNSTCSGVF